MPDELSRGWKQTGRFSGNYNDFHVESFKYVSPAGEVGWQTTSWPNLKDIIHNFWVSNDTFCRFGVHPAQSIISRQPIDIIDVDVNVDPDERTAILMAIEDWESPTPLGTDWRNFDPEDASTHPNNDRKIEPRFSNGRTVRAFFSAGFLGSVGYSNLISEVESNSKMHWRYVKES